MLMYMDMLYILWLFCLWLDTGAKRLCLIMSAVLNFLRYKADSDVDFLKLKKKTVSELTRTSELCCVLRDCLVVIVHKWWCSPYMCTVQWNKINGQPWLMFFFKFILSHCFFYFWWQESDSASGHWVWHTLICLGNIWQYFHVCWKFGYGNSCCFSSRKNKHVIPMKHCLLKWKTKHT